jgi:NAD(P)H-nitrite reductase large subunit
MNNSKVERINTNKNYIQTTDNTHIHYDKVLIATGASPVTPRVPNV